MESTPSPMAVSPTGQVPSETTSDKAVALATGGDLPAPITSEEFPVGEVLSERVASPPGHAFADTTGAHFVNARGALFEDLPFSSQQDLALRARLSHELARSIGEMARFLESESLPVAGGSDRNVLIGRPGVERSSGEAFGQGYGSVESIDASLNDPSDASSQNQGAGAETDNDSSPEPPAPQPQVELSSLTFSAQTSSIEIREGNVELSWGALSGTARVEGGFNSFLDAESDGASLTIDYGWAPGSIDVSLEESFALVWDTEMYDLVGFDTLGQGWTNIVGGDFDDKIKGSSSSTNTIDGGAGNDILTSLGHSNTLIGGLGDDLFFMAPDDHALGGPGADIFVLSTNVQIGDFGAEEDSLIIDFSGELKQLGTLPDTSELRPLYVTTEGNTPIPPASDAIYAIWIESSSSLNVFDSGNTPLITVDLPGLIGIGFDSGTTDQGFYWFSAT